MHAWDKFIALQEEELGSETVQKWLKPLKVLRFDACNLFLEAKDAFQAMWFEEHIRQKLQNKFFNNNNKKIKVHLSVANAQQKTEKTKVKKNVPSSFAETPPKFSLNFDELNPHCVFENYLVSEHNLLALKLFENIVAQSSTKAEMPVFNPIYIFGGKGCGKTHLLMAVAHALKKNGANVIFCRARTFTDHVVSAIRAGEMGTFRQAYRNSDVLIIDDIHVFSRKGATQEEFFHTFNTLHVAGKQIILSANCAPNELQYIEPRLISRFEWGISLSLESPTPQELKEILLKKAQAMNFPLNGKVADFLLETFGNSQSLNRALEALILRLHLSRNEMPVQTVAVARQILSDLILEEQQTALTPNKIILGVAEYFGIKQEDIQGKSQTRDCVSPRQLAMHLCRTLLKMPFTKIGDLFKKDHSTVMSSVKAIQKGIDMDDPDIASTYRAILKRLENQ